MFTATDFVSILRHFYIRGSPMTELAEHSIASWRGTQIHFENFWVEYSSFQLDFENVALPRSISNAKHQNGLISVTPEDSLYDSCKILREHRLHRIPIVDPVQNSVLSILTHSGILQYLVSSFREQRRLFDQPVYDLRIGTYENIITAPEQLPLIMILHTLIERRVSAIPIINVNGTLLHLQLVLIGSMDFFLCRSGCKYILCIECNGTCMLTRVKASAFSRSQNIGTR